MQGCEKPCSAFSPRPVARRRPAPWSCRAYRRALRLLVVSGIALARRLGLPSALPAPPWMPPDPDLSEAVQRVVASMSASIGRGINTSALGHRLCLCTGLLRTAGRRRRRVPRCPEPA